MGALIIFVVKHRIHLGVLCRLVVAIYVSVEGTYVQSLCVVVGMPGVPARRANHDTVSMNNAIYR